jgi:HAE1 family hydrophobic/amphiphilic exporter-1
VELVWFRDDGDYINAQVADGLGSIRDGVILTGIVLLLFLADIRTAFVAFVTIPVTMVISLMTFSWFGYTMNMVTMSAFGISVGILVANSIVVLENVAKAFEKGEVAKAEVPSLVERATSQVGLAVSARADQHRGVLPIASMKCITGKFMVRSP